MANENRQDQEKGDQPLSENEISERGDRPKTFVLVKSDSKETKSSLKNVGQIDGIDKDEM